MGDEETVGAQRCDYPGCDGTAVRRVAIPQIVGEGISNDESLCQDHAEEARRVFHEGNDGE